MGKLKNILTEIKHLLKEELTSQEYMDVVSHFAKHDPQTYRNLIDWVGPPVSPEEKNADYWIRKYAFETYLEASASEEWEGNLILKVPNMPIKGLGSLVVVDGNLTLGQSDIQNLGILYRVSGTLILSSNKSLESLGQLRYVGEDLYLDKSNVTDLGELMKVSGDLYLLGSKITREDVQGIEVEGEIYAEWAD